MILQSFAFGLVAALAFGVADFIAIIVARKIGVTRLLVWTHIAAVVIGTPYLLFGTGLPTEIPISYWAAFVGLSVLLLAILTTFYKGVQLAPVTMVSPIVAAHLVLVILLAVVFLQERLGAVQITGISAAVAGVLLVSMSVDSGRTGRLRVGRGVLLALATMLGAGFFVFSLGALSKEFGWFIPIYFIRLGTLVFLLPVQFRSHSWPWQQIPSKVVLVAVLVGTLQFGGLLAYALGAEVGQLSIVAVAFAVYPILPVLGGLLIFRERLAARQTVGVTLALGGLVVLGAAA